MGTPKLTRGDAPQHGAHAGARRQHQRATQRFARRTVIVDHQHPHEPDPHALEPASAAASPSQSYNIPVPPDTLPPPNVAVVLDNVTA
jgi:hypothetical protein